MAIKIGEVANPDEVLNVTGKTFQINSNLIWNGSLIGFQSNFKPNWGNVEYDVLSTYTNVDQTVSEIRDIPIFGAKVMDDFQDGTIDTNIWTAGVSSSESNGWYNQSAVNTTLYSTADQVNALDLNSDNLTVLIGYDFTMSSGSGNVSIQIVDESANAVTVVAHAYGSGTTGTNKKLRIEMDATGDNAQVYGEFQGNGAGTPVDCSSLVGGDEWHIRVVATSTDAGDTSTMKLRFIRYLENAVTTADMVTTIYDVGTEITNAILATSTDIGSNAVGSFFLSADSGVNYEAVIPNEIHRFTNTGSMLIMKTEMTTGSSTAAVDGLYQLNHYAIEYNLY